MKVSNNRYAKSFQAGKACEQKFKELMESRGHSVEKTSRNVDIYKHIDFYVDSTGVDIKGNRHLDCIWLEIDNVRGDKGWLRGEADFIVFDVVELNSFCFFKREHLLEYVNDNITEFTQTKKDYNKFYTRAKWGKKDKIVKVKYADIKHLLIQKLAY